MTSTVRLTAAVAMALLLAACGTGPGPEAILGVWEADRVEVDGVVHEFAAPGGFTVEFGGGHVLTGAAPCNGFEGWYEFDGETLDTADLVRGSAVCLDSRREADEAVFTVLEVSRFGVTFGDGTMTWEAGGVRVVFTRP